MFNKTLHPKDLERNFHFHKILKEFRVFFLEDVITNVVKLTYHFCLRVSLFVDFSSFLWRKVTIGRWNEVVNTIVRSYGRHDSGEYGVRIVVNVVRIEKEDQQFAVGGKEVFII